MKVAKQAVYRIAGLMSLLAIGVAAAPVIAGAQCWDIFMNNQIIDNCTAGASCYGNCNNFNDIRPGTTHLTVWSNPTPATIFCQKGTVKVDQFGVCHCMGPFGLPEPIQVGVISGDNACTER